MKLNKTGGPGELGRLEFTGQTVGKKNPADRGLQSFR